MLITEAHILECIKQNNRYTNLCLLHGFESSNLLFTPISGTLNSTELLLPVGNIRSILMKLQTYRVFICIKKNFMRNVFYGSHFAEQLFYSDDTDVFHFSDLIILDFITEFLC